MVTAAQKISWSGRRWFGGSVVRWSGRRRYHEMKTNPMKWISFRGNGGAIISWSGWRWSSAQWFGGQGGVGSGVGRCAPLRYHGIKTNPVKWL